MGLASYLVHVAAYGESSDVLSPALARPPPQNSQIKTMVAHVGATPYFASPRPEAVAEAESALTELHDEFGAGVVFTAFLRSPAGANFAASVFSARRVAQKILQDIVFSENPKLEAEIMAIAAGVLEEKGIVSRIAAKRGLTRQAVSKRAVAYRDAWGLPPPGCAKSDAARKLYALRNQPRL